MTNSKIIRNASLVMMFTGLGASSASVVLPLLREQYGLSYDFSGLLLAFLSVGNLAAALLCGFLPRFLGVRRTVLILSLGSMLGYVLMLISGFRPFLLLGFLLVGFGKGTSLNNATVAAGAASADRTGTVNLLNALFAAGSLAALLFHAAGYDAVGCRGEERYSFFKRPPFLVFSSLFVRAAVRGDQCDGMAGDIL